MRSHRKSFRPKSDPGTVELKIRQLTSEDKILLALYVYESLSIDDIACILRKEPQTIKTNIENILKNVFRGSPPANGVSTFAAEFLG